MEIAENVPLAPKTTMRIGGTARFFLEPRTKEDVETATVFAQEKGLPLVVLGGGSNTIFADGAIQAVVLRIKADGVTVRGNAASVQAGKNLPALIFELAEENLDLSPLTGILGSVGGAIFGNAGQGPKGIWIDAFVESVTAFGGGRWQTFTREECGFSYRESGFKHMSPAPVIWEATLLVPSRPKPEVLAEVERLLKRRIETQPHTKTAGSCFKAAGGTPAWQLIDAAGLRGKKTGGVCISEKHANFLINEGGGTFADTVALIEETKKAVSAPLDVEMRLIQENGSPAL